MKKEACKTITYAGLGDIVIKPNPSAQRFIFRVRNNILHLTTPQGVSQKEIYKAVSSMSGKLKMLLEKNKTPLIDLNFSIHTPFFKLEIKEGNRERFLAHSELGHLTIITPKKVNFEDRSLQSWLEKVIIEALRRNAKIILPPKLYMFAQKMGVSYNKLKVNSSQGRWGSCTGRKNINLSLYLMLLPEYLIDYVIIHELCHLQEMNHSDRFWNLVDVHTGGKAKELDTALKSYSTSIYITD